MKSEIDDILIVFTDNLIKSQQKLDVDFEKILWDNLLELYENDDFTNKVDKLWISIPHLKVKTV